MVAGWDDEGEIDLLDWFAELTIYTSSACLIGPRFRRRARRALRPAVPRPGAGHRPNRLRRPLRRHRELPPARRGAGGPGRAGAGDHGAPRRRAARTRGRSRPARRAHVDPEEDGSPRFSADTVTGMFISMMFAGHHTTSGTAAWTLIELLRHPEEMAASSTSSTSSMPTGRRSASRRCARSPDSSRRIKEALRLHPPLILLLRVAKEDLTYGGYRIAAGKLVGGQPGHLQPHPRGLPRPRCVRAGALPRTARGGPGQSVDLDPLRRRPPPLRRRRLRHDAAQGHLLRAAPGLGVRGGSAARDLPQRPLEDGRAARAAVPGALPAPEAGGGRR